MIGSDATRITPSIARRALQLPLQPDRVGPAGVCEASHRAHLHYIREEELEMADLLRSYSAFLASSRGPADSPRAPQSPRKPIKPSPGALGFLLYDGSSSDVYTREGEPEGREIDQKVAPELLETETAVLRLQNAQRCLKVAEQQKCIAELQNALANAQIRNAQLETALHDRERRLWEIRRSLSGDARYLHIVDRFFKD